MRERLLRDEIEAKARASAAAERAMPLQAVGEWIESLQTARSRSSRVKQAGGRLPAKSLQTEAPAGAGVL